MREIKTNILGKIRDKDKAVPASPLVKTTTSHLLRITNVRELPPLPLPASEYFSRFFFNEYSLLFSVVIEEINLKLQLN